MQRQAEVIESCRLGCGFSFLATRLTLTHYYLAALRFNNMLRLVKTYSGRLLLQESVGYRLPQQQLSVEFDSFVSCVPTLLMQ